jgi:hypothetical protein
LRGTAAACLANGMAGNGRKYGTADCILSAFAVSCFQHPSPLDFQKTLKSGKKGNKLETLIGLERTPGADQIRNMPGIERRDTGGLGRNLVFFMYFQAVFVQKLKLLNNSIDKSKTP